MCTFPSPLLLTAQSTLIGPALSPSPPETNSSRFFMYCERREGGGEDEEGREDELEDEEEGKREAPDA